MPSLSLIYYFIFHFKTKFVYLLCWVLLYRYYYCQIRDTTWSQFLPGFMVIKISSLNYSCKLATDQFSVLWQNNPNFWCHRYNKHKHKLDSLVFIAELSPLCFSLRQHVHSSWQIFERATSFWREKMLRKPFAVIITYSMIIICLVSRRSKFSYCLLLWCYCHAISHISEHLFTYSGRH